MNKYYKLLPVITVILAIIFNLFLYRAELSITTDPNDNVFQFTLVHRVDTIWKTYGCPWNPSCIVRLFDHWNPEWAAGYPLPFYYSHIPQIAIVLTYHLLSSIIGLFGVTFSLFQYYHVTTYIFLCIFPLSILLALRIMGFSSLVQIFGILFASHLSTDGLYGMDPTSYLWRGYGLSSQLVATVFMPLAFAYTYKALIIQDHSEYKNKNSNSQFGNSQFAILFSKLVRNLASEIRHYAKPILFLVLTLSSHLGLGYITLLSFIPLLIPLPSLSLKELIRRLKCLSIIVGASFALLSYWIIPFILGSNYNSISYWDPIWKFNSFGYNDVLIRLFHGELIDFDRFPIFTILTFIGFFVILFIHQTISNKKVRESHEAPSQDNLSILIRNSQFNNSQLDNLALLFPFWILLFFGRSTWGPLINLLPAAESFHLHRFINGLHLSVLFLAPIGAAWVAEKVFFLLRRITNITNSTNLSYLQIAVYSLSLIFFLSLSYGRTISYARPNTQWIANANSTYLDDKKDFDKLTKTLTSLPPGRIYAGRGGYWGKDFKIGSSTVYMALSTQGFEVSQFLPETWSPNSDTEQNFDERIKSHYELYNIRYVIAPPDIKMPEFVKFKTQFNKYVLYEVDSGGYFSIGTSALAVQVNRINYLNAVHLWQISKLPENNLFPIITFNTHDRDKYPNNITLYDTNMYMSGGKMVSIFDRSPFGFPPNFATPSATFKSESVKAGQEYKTTVTVPPTCKDCMVILKTTYHPNWNVYIDGEKVEKRIVFPFFIGVPIKPGDHVIEAKYQPSLLKILLLIIPLGISLVLLSKKINTFRSKH